MSDTMTTSNKAQTINPADIRHSKPHSPANPCSPSCSGYADTLITALWDFIENVGDEDPERTDKFFALREKVRNYLAGRGEANTR
jgi:hypothetical protein